jgi:hypothetical protein
MAVVVAVVLQIQTDIPAVLAVGVGIQLLLGQQGILQQQRHLREIMEEHQILVQMRLAVVAEVQVLLGQTALEIQVLDFQKAGTAVMDHLQLLPEFP